MGVISLLGLVAALAQDVKVAPDASLSPEAYVERGLPPPDRPWTGKDYAAGVEVLKAIADEDPTQLPRFGSSASGEVFARICSEENLGLIRDGKIPVLARLQEAANLMGSTPQILVAYGAMTPLDEGIFDEELVSLMIFQFVLMGDLLPIADEFLVSLPEDDPQREARHKGMAQMKSGMVVSVNGGVSVFEEESGFRDAALLRFARGFKRSLLPLASHIPPTPRRGIASRFGKLSEGETGADLRKEFEELAKVFQE